VSPFRRDKVREIIALVDILKSPGADKLSSTTLNACIILLIDHEADDWLTDDIPDDGHHST